MSGIPWDQPGADPVADIRASIKALHDSAYRPKIFFCPPALAAQWEQEHGRPLTVADINRLGPGLWSEVIFV